MLKLFYGIDTRSVRVLNLTIHLLWAYLIITHLSGLAQVHLPEKAEPNFSLILGLAVTTIAATSLSFADNIYKMRIKYLSLVLGSITQTLIGLKYASIYPPFDVMVLVCSILAIWFVGGAIYVKNRQGITNANGES